jgi:hypothetical protein
VLLEFGAFDFVWSDAAAAHMHGRRTIALINVLDVVVLSYAVLIVLLVLDTLDTYDALLIAAHFLHAITAPLGYIVVRHSAPARSALRLLMMLYVVSIALDIAAFTLRLILLTGVIAHTASLTAPTASSVRCIVALLFVGIDFCGAFFCDISHQYALLPQRSDAETVALARSLAQQPKRLLEERSERFGAKLVAVYPSQITVSPAPLPV